MWSSLVAAVKVEYDSIRIWPRAAPVERDLSIISVPRSAYDDSSKNNSMLKSPCLGVHRGHNLRISCRVSFQMETVNLQGWPSRGGIIVLEHATPPDFDFLQLDSLDPPLRRDADQDAEDTFCQALLHLGAIWWDSEKRRRFVGALEHSDEAALEAVEANEDLGPTRRERSWVRVAWPSHPPGALCVLACEKPIMGKRHDQKMPPRNHAIISLARTMDERCKVIQRFGGIMYASIDEYQGPGFLKAWEDDHQGEKGPLFVEEFIDPAKYGGYPDDALLRPGITRPLG